MRWRRGLATGALMALLGGCSSDAQMTDLQHFLEQARARPQGRIEPLPQFEPYQAFDYQAGNLRSPFRASATAPPPSPRRETGSIRPDPQRPREYLEQFRLEALRLVGTLQLEEDGIRWALIETADGDVHHVRVGNYIGRDHGRIVRITEQQVELIEIIADSEGGWGERSRTLSLQEEP